MPRAREGRGEERAQARLNAESAARVLWLLEAMEAVRCAEEGDGPWPRGAPGEGAA